MQAARLVGHGVADGKTAYAPEMALVAAEAQLRSVNSVLVGGALMAAGSAATSYVTGFGCPIYEIGGCWCAFCGATRAVVTIFDGNAGLALRSNGLVVLILGLIAVRFALLVTGGRRMIASADSVIVRVDIRVWIGVLLTWTLVRNLPWAWFLGPVR